MNALRPPGAVMEGVAAKLGRRPRQGKPASRRAAPVPCLWFLTDPIRTPDPIAIAARLPRGAAVVYRTFGSEDRLAIASALRRLTHARGLKLLIGTDWRLAAVVGADGVHLPQRLAYLAPRLRRSRPGWLISTAAHNQAAIIAAARWRVDAILASVVFDSRSRSATGRVLGPVRFAAMVRASWLPVIALGGVNDRTAPRLLRSAAAGLAGVEVFEKAGGGRARPQPRT
ncbi:MAG TPA: thiamine phosphate synthase [Caulobacteraceae bacterium]|jgi:thiamine-phosphate pyrophosphorylase|nr:thiamine phosphate synthase [Caulobacteraceae bacterium]